MPGAETRFAVLLFSDLVGSTDLKARHGVPAFTAALRIHNGHFERLAHESRGIRILQNAGDGYFAEGDSVSEVVKFALLFQDAMRAGPWDGMRLTARVGIHAGEISALESEGGSGVVAPAADLAARVMSLAVGGQVLLTRFPFDEARHFIREHPAVDGKSPPLRWLAHGPYRLSGRDEPLEIFEVGADGLAPLAPPPDGEKAKRAIRPGEEETLGWRPAVGLEIPGRTGWQLTEKLGAGGFGEVWTGEHAKLRQRRAFKFCFDDERLRALKREVTIVRLLRSALGERDDIVHLHELKLDSPPFYLESDLAPHGNLLQWAEREGGLGKIPLARRIALVAHTATALAAAHSIGVLHKDIKPTNILIFDGPSGEPRPRLVDFGIGTLADPAVLGHFGVTGAGFTRTNVGHNTGTPTYSPPEYLAGKPYTIQGDIYGLGVLLYQLITIKPLDPLAHGWEREIADPLLREDIAACVEGDPARRLPSAADLAERLLTLEVRRVAILENEGVARETAARAEAEAAALAARAEAEAAALAARARAIRFRKLAAAFAILAVLAIVGGVLARMNQHKADAALGEVARRKAEVDRKNDEYRAIVAEAARSDRLVAEEKLQADREPEAFAHLARACEYDPQSTFAAEKAAAALNAWRHLLPVTIFAGHEAKVVSAQFSPDGMRIVTASWDKTARVWDTMTGQCLTTLAGHERILANAQFSRDGRRIVTASADGTARVWDAVTGKGLTTLAGHERILANAQFSRDGRRIVTASADGTARVWDATTGKSLVTLAGHEEEVLSAQFSPDGTRIVTASNDKTARVWDTATGQSLAMLAGHENLVNSAQFSPDGTRIVTASWDKTARVWDAATGQILATLSGHEERVRSAQFSPDGSRIVTASGDRTARVWDAATGQSLATLAGHEGGAESAQFSLDGMRIVTASWDKTARVWDAATGKSLATLVGHKNGLLSARFSPDGTRIVTVSSNETARVWNVLAPSAGVPPEWFPDFLRYMAQMRLNPDGELETLKPDDWLALRKRMREVRRAGAGQDTPYLRILRRFVPE